MTSRRLVRLYASVFEAGGVPLDDTPRDAAHMACLLTTLVCVVPLLGVHIALGGIFLIAAAFDVVAIAYALLIVAAIKFSNLPHRGDNRRMLYSATVFVSALTVLVAAWVHGPGHMVHFYAAMCIIVGHFLHVAPHVLWAVHGGHLVVVVAQSCDVAWAAFGHRPLATHVNHALLGPGFVFLWHLLGNMGVAVGIQCIVRDCTKRWHYHREAIHLTVSQGASIAKLLKKMDTTRAKAQLAVETPHGSIGRGVLNALRRTVLAMEMFRAFLPDYLNRDEAPKPPLPTPVVGPPGLFEPMAILYDNVPNNAEWTSSASSSAGSLAKVPPAEDFMMMMASQNSALASSNHSIHSRLAVNASRDSLNSHDSPEDSQASTVSKDSSSCPGTPLSLGAANDAMDPLSWSKSGEGFTNELVVMTLELDPTHINTATAEEISACLHTLQVCMKKWRGRVFSYRAGEVVVLWPRPQIVCALAAATQVQECLLVEHKTTCRMGLDLSVCALGMIGATSLLMFNELRGPAVEGSLALCTLCTVLDAHILVSCAIKKCSSEDAIYRLVGYSVLADVIFGPCTLSGIKEENSIFEVVHEGTQGASVRHTDLSILQDQMESVATFENAIQYYASGDHDEAERLFQQMVASNKTPDKVAVAYSGMLARRR